MAIMHIYRAFKKNFYFVTAFSYRLIRLFSFDHQFMTYIDWIYLFQVTFVPCQCILSERLPNECGNGNVQSYKATPIIKDVFLVKKIS